jgi:hypothetical protein
MRGKLCLAVVVCACVAVASVARGIAGGSTQADEVKLDKIGIVKKAIADSKLPGTVKDLAAKAMNPTYGKVYSLWPMSNGTFYFALSTPQGDVGFTFKTGELTADAMLKVLLFAYEKQIAVWVYDDPLQPQVATGVVTITP